MATTALPKQISASSAADFAAIWHWLCAGSITCLRTTVQEGRAEGEFRSTTSSGGTSQEIAVLRRLLLGQSLKQIAVHDGASISTISLYARRAATRMGATKSGALSLPLIHVIAATAYENLRPNTKLIESPAEEAVKAVIELPPPSGYEQLSDVERSVFWLVCGGAKIRAISAARGCSERTTANHLAAMFRRFNVQNGAGLIALVAQTALASLH